MLFNFMSICFGDTIKNIVVLVSVFVLIIIICCRSSFVLFMLSGNSRIMTTNCPDLESSVMHDWINNPKEEISNER